MPKRAFPPEGHLYVTSHLDPSTDLPRSLQLGPSSFPLQRVGGPLEWNKKYAMPEMVIDVSLESLKSIAWFVEGARSAGDSLVLFVLALDPHLATAYPRVLVARSSSKSGLSVICWLF